MSILKTKVLIIGSGPAGCSAAIYTARANLQPILVHGVQPGGQLTITTDVENYPGFAKAVQGPWLMSQMIEQAESMGTRVIQDLIIQVDFSKRPFTAFGESGSTYFADAVIISTGAQAKWLGLPSEEKFKGFGVSGCATCDGMFFRNKHVMVVGGGNTAVEESLYLTKHAEKVTLIHRRDQLRAEKILQRRLFSNEKVKIIWNSVLQEVIGTEAPKTVTGAKITNILNNKVQEIPVDGIFIAIGHEPNTKLFKEILEIDKVNYIVTKAGSTTTSIPGIFAAGDVQDKIFKQAVTAAGTGCMAALEAEKFLSK